MFSTAAAYLGVYYCKWRVLICKTYWLFSDLMNSRTINYSLHHSEQDTTLWTMKILSSKCTIKRIDLARPCANQHTLNFWNILHSVTSVPGHCVWAKENFGIVFYPFIPWDPKLHLKNASAAPSSQSPCNV